MKRIVTGLLVLALGLGLGCGRQKAEQGRASQGADPAPKAASVRISISGAWALYPMVVRWTEEYRTLHPETAFDVSAGGAGKGMTDALSGSVDLGMVSRDINAAEKEKGAWWVSVVKDAVVPTINAEHPAAAALVGRGLKKDEFKNLWITGTLTSWASLVKVDGECPVHVYTRSDACGAAQTWAAYLGGAQEDLQGTAVYGDPGLAEAVRKDALGIGFNNLNFAYDTKTGKPVAGIQALPIDIDGNGKVDPAESFYGSAPELATAIADGRYPSPPARMLHLVAKGKPPRPEVLAFLRWSLNEGQAFVADAGYIALTPEQITESRDKLE